MCRCQDRYGFWRVTRKREIRSYLLDMDGVLVREDHAIPGAEGFIARCELRACRSCADQQLDLQPHETCRPGFEPTGSISVRPNLDLGGAGDRAVPG